MITIIIMMMIIIAIIIYIYFFYVYYIFIFYLWSSVRHGQKNRLSWSLQELIRSTAAAALILEALVLSGSAANPI